MEMAVVTTAEEGQADPPELVRRFIAGEPAAFEEILRIYSPRVARLALRLSGYSTGVEDIVQDVFVAALEKSRKFRAGSTLWTWLTAITINCCRKHHRRQRVRDFGRRWLVQRKAKESPAADADSIDRERDSKVREVVSRLRPAERETIVLYYLEEMPIEEICSILMVSRPAIEVRLHRARARLRAFLSE